MDYYLSAFWKFIEFKGRASRAEYWSFILINFLVKVGLILIAINSMNTDYFMDIVFVFIIFNLVVLLPTLSVSIRRLHDIGKNGWFFLIAFIPLIGSIWLFFYFITDSDVGENKYGINPKGITKEKHKKMTAEEIKKVGIARQNLMNEELLK